MSNLKESPTTPPPFHGDEPKWFALKVSRKETLATTVLETAGLRTYCPLTKTDTTIQGKKIIVERPLIPNTIFVYASFKLINALKNQHPFITYCYKKMDGKYKILQVPTREMERFIDSSTKMQGDITYYRPEEVELHKGDHVKIVGGLFDGYEGTLLKAKGRAKRMFLINFEMLGALGTHIEPQYIRIIK
ncbi:MAG: UpxY family transcription antiterminator [Bacteroidaceae bacterium]|nr:UpxY family transcription antiterminator [Bacteroidaceae bacterium]MDE6721990.1 UpxY family transcription antiterminator [Bacteroidaceae bacterium]